MAEEKRDSVISRVLEEAQQGPATRHLLYEAIEEHLRMPVLSYFTSFGYRVMIDDVDANMIESALQSMDLSKGVALLISSPGGSGEAAERIINSLRSYSKTNEFLAIVPGKAKSAATLICLGASKIIMGPASELGPVDPQIPIWDESDLRWDVSAYHVTQTYNSLFNDAKKAKDENLQPYLQQLGRYHASIVSHLESAIALSEDISIKALQVGMMKGKTDNEIRDSMKLFLSPEGTKVHGRPIFRDAADEAGLNVDAVDHKSEFWLKLYELYIRLNQLTEGPIAKAIETTSSFYYLNPPKQS